jgi:hypothetical protein
MTCRLCSGKTQKTGLLYRCKGTNCKSVYWDKRAVLKLIKDNKDDEEYYKLILKNALIPEIKGKSYCYRLKLKNIKDLNNKDEKTYIEKNASYVGRTNLHPYARYLNHIRGHLSAKGRAQTKKRAVALIEYEGPMTYDQSKIREIGWANDLRKQNIIVYQN